jgi:hypothetical protein
VTKISLGLLNDDLVAVFDGDGHEAADVLLALGVEGDGGIGELGGSGDELFRVSLGLEVIWGGGITSRAMSTMSTVGMAVVRPIAKASVARAENCMVSAGGCGVVGIVCSKLDLEEMSVMRMKDNGIHQRKWQVIYFFLPRTVSIIRLPPCSCSHQNTRNFCCSFPQFGSHDCLNSAAYG